MTFDLHSDVSGDDEVAFGPLSLAIIRLSRAHKTLAGHYMREVGLTPEQGALMMHIWSVGAVRQTTLSEHFSKDSASTTRTVQRMEQAGFVRRRSDPSDGRASLIETTSAGNALRSRVEELWTRLERVTDGGMSGERRQEALELMLEMGDSVLAELRSDAPREIVTHPS